MLMVALPIQHCPRPSTRLCTPPTYALPYYYLFGEEVSTYLPSALPVLAFHLPHHHFGTCTFPPHTPIVHLLLPQRLFYL